MIGSFFLPFFSVFYRQFFLAPIAKPLLDTILMTLLPSWFFVPVLILAAAVRLYAAFLRLRPWACPFSSSGNECGSLGGGLIMGYLMGVPFRDACS